MPTEQQVPEAIQTVERLLSEAAGRGIHLEMKDHDLADDWLYVVLSPALPGGRASDYARLMADIESDLSRHGIENVLLVPAVEE